MPYSEKVIEHMRNPRNVGEIPDADGIGRVGNPVCLVPGTEILTNPEEKAIEQAAKSELVLSHDGVYHQILEVMSRDFEGDAIRIKNRLGTSILTSEHQVLAIRVPKRHKYLYIKNKKKLTPEWVRADSLSKGDLALYPMPSEVEDVADISVDISKRKFDHRSNVIPLRIPIDADFLRLSGYYLAEGSLNDKVTKSHILFTFHLNEEDLAQDVVQTVQKIFDVSAKEKEIPRRKTRTVSINNVFIVRLFKKLFGVGAENKAIPAFMMKLPRQKQAELLRGLWKGDGFFNLKIPRAGYSTISKKLSGQVKLLLFRQGVIPSVYVEEEKITRNVRHKRAYRFHVGNRQSVRKLFKIVFGREISFERPESNDSWCDDYFLYLPITSVSTKKYSGKVYNLLVEDAHSYVASSLTVHNCGDVMSVYIKVRDNIITDIKFQTMGCGAAIATSSIITELAKGKTIEDALKITRQDVADALGGLPPIKMHCSNLAADALHEAIHDYKEKHGIKQK